MQKQRISTVSAFFLIGTALLIDLAQFFVAFIPVIDVVLDFFLGTFALILFGIWFALLGVNYFKGRQTALKVTAMATTAVVEMVPLLDALPAITIGVLTIIWLTWKEDRATDPAAGKNVTKLASIARMQSGRDTRKAIEASRTTGLARPENEEQKLAKAQERREARRQEAMERFGYTPPGTGTP